MSSPNLGDKDRFVSPLESVLRSQLVIGFNDHSATELVCFVSTEHLKKTLQVHEVYHQVGS